VSWTEVLEPDHKQPQWWRDQLHALRRKENLQECLKAGRAPFWPAPSREELERLIEAPLPSPTDESLVKRAVLACNECKWPLELLFKPRRL